MLETRTGIVRRTLEVEITPEELAAAFLGMDSVKQAECLNRIGEVMPGDPDIGWSTQLCYVADELKESGWNFIEYLNGLKRDR